jgi:hypothetical protein
VPPFFFLGFVVIVEQQRDGSFKHLEQRNSSARSPNSPDDAFSNRLLHSIAFLSLCPVISRAEGCLSSTLSYRRYSAFLQPFVSKPPTLPYSGSGPIESQCL